MKSFCDLVDSSVACGMPLSDFAEWCGLSRKTICKYMDGMVNPLNVPYVNIINLASHLDVSPDEVYNSIRVSFYSKHIYCQTLGKWMLPEEIIEKVR